MGKEKAFVQMLQIASEWEQEGERTSCGSSAQGNE